MYQVGLTGGIAAGKSTVVDRFQRVHGLRVVDADRLARDVVAPGTEGLAEVIRAFGPSVIHPDGSMNRAAVGEKIFAHPELRRVLEEIIHPRVIAEQERVVATATDPVLVHDVPLLFEAHMEDRFDEIVVVHCPAVIRVQRLIQLRGMSADDAWARVHAQFSDEDRLARADVVIDNTKSIDDLNEQVDALAQRLLANPATTT